MRKEFRTVKRNRQNFGVLLVAPVLQLIIFGFASRMDVNNVPMVVVDQSRSVLSRQVTDAFSRSGYFTIVAYLNRYDDVDVYLQKGQASMALLIPPDFERRIQGLQTADVGVLIDGVDTTTAGTAAGYVQSILGRFTLDITTSRVDKMQGLLYQSSTPRLIVPGFSIQSRAWFNPNLTSKDFFVPGVVVIIMLALSVMVTSTVIVREKEMGTIEQLMVTPITRLELIAGKALPCFIVELVSLSVILPLAFLIFDVPFRGPWPFFLMTFLIFLVAASGIGITISAFCGTQQQAMLSSFMFLQPAVLLSGYAFPIENMPVFIQYFTYLNPVRHIITIVRGVFLKGTGWEVLWPSVVALTVMAIFFVVLASLLFKRRVD